MCGRLVLYTLPYKIAKIFRISDVEPDLFPPRFNVPPTVEVPAVRLIDGERRLDMLRWWLVPSWSKEEKSSYPTFNARSETAPSKPAFRVPFKSRRCLIPVDGFYEWMKVTPKDKVPHFIHRGDGEPAALAGLWDRWEGPDKVVHSCTILTTAANGFMAPYHDRMPCVLGPETWDYWLDPGNKNVPELESLLAPREWPGWEAYPVSTRVNKAGGGGPELIERAA